MNPRGKVKINLEIYKTIIATTTRYANTRIAEENWAEVYGLLYGYIEGDDVIITEAIPFTHTKKQRHILKVEFEEEDYALAASIESEYYLRDPPQYIIGWYHSHPGIKLMLSQDDVKNQLAWQTNNPLAIALVFNPQRLVRQVEVPSRMGDPMRQLELDTGFLVFRLDDPNRGLEASFHEVPFEFTDFEVDEVFINNAQEFVNWTTKAFPRGEAVVTEYKSYIDNTLKKLQEVYEGTRSYIQTLIRKGEQGRIEEVIQRQAGESQKVLNQGSAMVNIFNIMKGYLEYKEREEMVPKIDEILARWASETEGYMDKFLELMKS
jgi:proteasome lid subunit RPN8/RPN11